MSDKQKIIDQEDKIESLGDEVASLEDKLSYLNGVNERLESEIEHLHDEIGSLEIKICQLEDVKDAKPDFNALFDAKDDKEKFDLLISKMYYDYLGRIV